VWDQGAGMMGDWSGRFAPSFEFVFHFNKKSVKPNKWIDKQEESIKVNTGGGMRNKTGVVGGRSNPEASLQPTKIPDSVIRVNRVAGSDIDHPAMFPVNLSEYAIRSWHGLVYEPFSGSGTTIIAGENLGRQVRAIEISPAYVAVALERFRQHTQIEPVLCA
jgi:DNA modification methylase